MKQILAFIIFIWQKLLILAEWLGEGVLVSVDWLRYKIPRERRYLYAKQIAYIMGTVGSGCLLLGYFQGYDAAAPFAFPLLLASVLLSGRKK